MKLIFRNSMLLFVLVFSSANIAHADLLEETCNNILGQLKSGPYENLKKSNGKFTGESETYKKRTYHGCVIHLIGNINNIIDTQRPSSLLGGNMDYCHKGKQRPGFPRVKLNKNGWCVDRIADGPDGTELRALKKNIFCTIEGNWDGGDDSDPKYVPSNRYEVIVSCAVREQNLKLLIEN